MAITTITAAIFSTNTDCECKNVSIIRCFERRVISVSSKLNAECETEREMGWVVREKEGRTEPGCYEKKKKNGHYTLSFGFATLSATARTSKALNSNAWFCSIGDWVRGVIEYMFQNKVGNRESKSIFSNFSNVNSMEVNTLNERYKSPCVQLAKSNMLEMHGISVQIWFECGSSWLSKKFSRFVAWARDRAAT